MGFMNKWRNWSQEQWDGWAWKLQPTYEKIDSWDTPKWVKKLCEDLWDVLDATTKKKLYDFIMEIVKKYDAKFAKQLIEDLLNKLLDLLKIKDKK